MIPALLAVVAKETGGKNWSRGCIWEMDGKILFLCNKCSNKALESLQAFLKANPLDEEQESLVRERVNSDVIVPPPEIPEKYKTEMEYAGSHLFRLVPNGMLKCEACGKIVT